MQSICDLITNADNKKHITKYTVLREGDLRWFKHGYVVFMSYLLSCICPHQQAADCSTHLVN